MPTTFRVSVVLAAALAAVGLPGCGSGGTSAPPPFNEVELKEIHDLYMGHIKKHQKPPAQMSDFSKKEIIERRIDPLMRPRTPPETSGDADLGVNNVLFVCGAYFYGGDLYFPYAGADSVVLGGKIPADELAGYTA